MKSEKLKVEKARVSVRGIAPVAFALFTFHFSLFTAASAQDDPPDLAPPPLKIVSREELARLATENVDIKARTKLVLEMMNGRLTSAEKLSAGDNLDGMFRELGHFHALMENGLEFLERRSKTAGKVLDNYKRLEIGFRSFVPRLETVRRVVPLRYEDYIRKLIKFVREARTKATEPMFSDSVVRTKNGR